MNSVLLRILGGSVHTTLLNAPILVFVGWGIGVPLDLQFEVFDAVIIILSIFIIGNFTRDGKSDFLEGILCILLYILVAIAAFYYPNPPSASPQDPTKA